MNGLNWDMEIMEIGCEYMNVLDWICMYGKREKNCNLWKLEICICMEL